MAREQRKDVDYFPHECNHGRKMHIIERKYGNDGYAVWFKLLEQLGKANDHYIDISDETQMMWLTSIFNVDEEKTKLILNDLSKLEAIDKVLFEEYKVIYSHKFSESVKDAYRNRKGIMTEYSVILNSVKLKNGQSCASLPQEDAKPTEVIPKVKKSKEEDSIEEEKKENYTKNDLIYNELIISESWIESTAMQSDKKFTPDEVKVFLKKYNDMINVQFEFKNNKTEYCTHFIYWLNKQEKNKNTTDKKYISPTSQNRPIS